MLHCVVFLQCIIGSYFNFLYKYYISSHIYWYTQKNYRTKHINNIYSYSTDDIRFNDDLSYNYKHHIYPLNATFNMNFTVPS